MRILLVISMIVFTSLVGCQENESPTKNENTTQPEIVKLSTTATEILIADAAIVTCEATGGNLEYTWEVLLGDIIPMNEEGSQVRYSGAECCIGEKEITCTVKNDKGEDKKIIIISITDK